MEPKKNKYDTNPLDPDVAKRTEEVWGTTSTGSDTQQVKGATGEVGSPAESPRSNLYSEAPTRHFDNSSAETPYPSVFIPPTYAPPSVYQPPPSAPESERPTSRPVAGVGLAEKWAMVLPYAPFVGIVAAIIELLLVPRKETRVRFHAAQGLALHLAILIIGRLFWFVSFLTDSSLGGSLFRAVSLAFLIISMLRVWRGEPNKISPLIEPAHWFNEHIEPRTKS
ncbi:MAG TPA: hypothetical protein VIV66_12010 [Pyrinomonadaceae bacterium]